VSGELVAVDAVLNINQDALFRHPELEELRRELPVEDAIAEEAQRNSWTYIDLDGDIGILSSGAGLTMAILDLIERAGGRAANFLDTAQIDDEGIVRAFELIVRAKPVKSVLVNIFAGLNRCDGLARGITRYLADNPLPVPVVVRMIGNREEEGYRILRDAGIEPVAELEPAVEMAVAAAQGR
jgi:succinyl-CoA synthetase beta subunit